MGPLLLVGPNFVDCPSWWNAAALGLDVGGGLIPAVAGAGSGLIHGDEAVGAVSKAINKADAGCFVAGTPVETKSGAKSIEEVEPGDYVWSRDPETGQEAWREVTETTIRHDIPVLRLETATTDGSTDALSTTGEHPFWVNGQGWTPARQLEPGDEVFNSAGGWLRVTSATWLQDTRTVYNLEVDGFHTYFVGASGAWVHNTCSDWGDLANKLWKAKRGKGNFGIGKGTSEQAEAMGRAWVGEGAQWSSNRKALISRDGLRQYRPPSHKPNLGKTQANFEARKVPKGEWQHNAHLDVTD